MGMFVAETNCIGVPCCAKTDWLKQKKAKTRTPRNTPPVFFAPRDKGATLPASRTVGVWPVHVCFVRFTRSPPTPSRFHRPSLHARICRELLETDRHCH